MNAENWMLAVVGSLFIVTEASVRITRLAINARAAKRREAAKAATS